ncbi:ArsR/SmtB family transcription factor [Acidomonas methanolica]|uniref:ArsR/SmtB family transcription factor n=1 Tax=Acidomonas methanolica TaxID=437 RepID=UPI002119BE70|nr:metalloregulator ArsR/SmtB family transcription factor [Acidomonas methanolica]MCQ9154112.1 metalloregulator ArsR/SmtB family transcription factor [Acidomonas methanolica]
MPDPLSLFQSLADPTRLRILALLRQMELSVGELAQVLGQSQPRVSRHLRVMVEAGLVSRRKEGNWVFVAPGPARLVEPAFAAIDAWQEEGDPQAEADSARLAAIKSLRVTEAEDYFESHAAEWDAIRSLHVAEAEVEEAILRTLSGRTLGTLADLGTGTGRMIQLLAPLADRAIGIDRSPAMLRVARSKFGDPSEPVAGQQIAGQKITWQQGDLSALPLQADGVDTAIMHQVLHYVTHPGPAIAEAARILRPGGRLLVVDFAAHDRTELRDRDAHAWLGFSDDRMRGWLAEAGFGTITIATLDGPIDVRLWLGTLRG